jgi:hypothetical protein
MSAPTRCDGIRSRSAKSCDIRLAEAVLEGAWEKRYANITGHSTLAEPLIGFREQAVYLRLRKDCGSAANRR